MKNKKILILCTGNSCRSQMAEGFMKSFGTGLEVCSAGTDPAPVVHPKAIQVMAEEGIDISGNVPMLVDQFLDQKFDYMITVCDGAKESCPAFIGNVKNRIHFNFEDPALAEGIEHDILAVFRKIRDQIKVRFSQFFQNSIQK